MATAKKSKKKKVYIDTRGVFAKIKRETGKKITAKSFCEEYGFSTPTITKWNSEAPNTISVLYVFLKQHNLKFEDLVKCE